MPKIKPNTAFLSAVGDSVDPIFKSSRNGPQIVEADIDRIEPNPDQPRQYFDEAELQTLADSIEKHGLQQPVGLKQLEPGHWQLVYGERRLRACKLLGRQIIFGVLVTSGDTEEIALIENVQRADLSPLDEAFAFQRLMERHGYSQGTLATIVGRDRAEINRTLGLLKLPEEIRSEYASIKPAPARYRLYKIAAEKDPARQAALWQEIKAEALPSHEEQDDASAMPAARKERQVKPKAAQTLSALLRTARTVGKDVSSLNALRGQTLDAKDRASLERLRDTIDAVLSEQD